MSVLELSWPSRVHGCYFVAECALSVARSNLAEPSWVLWTGSWDGLHSSQFECVNCWRKYYCFAAEKIGR